MRKANSNSAALLKQARAITSHSNSPSVKHPVQQHKDTPESSQKFRILRQHIGVYFILHSYLSETNLGGTGL